MIGRSAVTFFGVKMAVWSRTPSRMGIRASLESNCAAGAAAWDAAIGGVAMVHAMATRSVAARVRRGINMAGEGDVRARGLVYQAVVRESTGAPARGEEAHA